MVFSSPFLRENVFQPYIHHRKLVQILQYITLEHIMQIMSALETHDRRPWRFFRKKSQDAIETKKENKLFDSWEETYMNKLVAAKAKGMPMRFVEGIHASEATYYSLEAQGDIKIIFADIDRDTGEGKRSAVVLCDGRATFLRTGKKEMSYSHDPHKWFEVQGKERKAMLENELTGFKAARLYTPDRVGKWMGYYPDTQQVLSFTSSKNLAS